MSYPLLFKLAILTTVFGMGHHIDHVIRGNHMGWPLIAEVTPFTYSLGFYPFALVGLWLHVRGGIGPGYWTVLLTVGALFVGLAHFGPVAVEPPADVIGPYDSAVAGYAALAWLVAFLLIMIGSGLHAARLWRRTRSGTA